ncbi:hypothetical protein Tsubulata_041079, partial [Turnera subulata]
EMELTVAVIISAQDNKHVFDEGDQGECIENQREDTQNVIVVLDTMGEGARIHIQRKKIVGLLVL